MPYGVRYGCGSGFCGLVVPLTHSLQQVHDKNHGPADATGAEDQAGPSQSGRGTSRPCGAEAERAEHGAEHAENQAEQRQPEQQRAQQAAHEPGNDPPTGRRPRWGRRRPVPVWRPLAGRWRRRPLARWRRRQLVHRLSITNELPWCRPSEGAEWGLNRPRRPPGRQRRRGRSPRRPSPPTRRSCVSSRASMSSWARAFARSRHGPVLTSVWVREARLGLTADYSAAKSLHRSACEWTSFRVQ